jgi:hypothetical protein
MGLPVNSGFDCMSSCGCWCCSEGVGSSGSPYELPGVRSSMGEGAFDVTMGGFASLGGKGSPDGPWALTLSFPFEGFPVEELLEACPAECLSFPFVIVK